MKIPLLNRVPNKATVTPTCGRCRLYDPVNGLCGVIVLHEGERISLPMDPGDACFFDQEFRAIDANGVADPFKAQVKQVRMWTEDPTTGEKAQGDGVVKLEADEDFFERKPSKG